MKQTSAHGMHNPDLLVKIPKTSKFLVEVGCSSGALAREFKKIQPLAHYVGIEIEPQYAMLARRHCDVVLACDIETVDDAFFSQYAVYDCWIFGDTLEHFKNPWRVLSQIRAIIPDHGCVVACIPNAQHWSVQARLASGAFRYEESGLLDKSHLRWFTRTTIIELFEECGFCISEISPRIFNEPKRVIYLPAILSMATAAGIPSQQAMQEALPVQYVIRAEPRCQGV